MSRPGSPTDYVWRSWRSVVTLAARFVPLTSPVLCMLFAAFVFWVALICSGAYHYVLGTIFTSFLRPYEEQLRIANKVAQGALVFLAFMFVARTVQLCYPERFK